MHHVALLSREGGAKETGEEVVVEVMSIDTDEWVAFFLMYAVFPSTRNTRVIVRQQHGSNPGATCHIDVLKLFEGMVGLGFWPHTFTPLQKCMPLIAAYMLCGHDFSPTLSGYSSMKMFKAYCEAIKDPTNHPFIEPLGSARVDGETIVALDLDELACAKFVSLAYFWNNRGIFGQKLPGHQVSFGTLDGCARFIC